MYREELRNINLNNTPTKSTLYAPERVEGRGTHYLTDDPTHYEIQRSNTFMFYVPFPAGYFENDSILASSNTYASSHANDVFRISVDSSFVPHFTTNAIELKRGNNTMKFAGTPTFSNGQVKFTDFIGAGTKDLLMAWQRKVYNQETEKVGLASDYKLLGYLTEYTPDFQVVRTWKLIGCWISALSEDDYSHDSSDKHSITCTIEYDWATVDTSSLDFVD